MIERALKDILSADVTVSGLVSDRIAPGNISQGESFPLIRFTVDRDPGLKTYDGQEKPHLGRASVDAWGDTYLETRQLADAAADALRNYAGTVGGSNIEAIYIEDAVIVFEDNIKKYRETMLLDVHVKQ